jgi:hypothetical protein
MGELRDARWYEHGRWPKKSDGYESVSWAKIQAARRSR